MIFDLRPHAPSEPENETPWLVSAALEQLAPLLVSRPVSSPARLLLRGAADRRKQVSLPRPSRWRSPEREAEVFRMASATVGYADLARLEVGQVEGMFRRFRDAQAIVFDMRGYPRGTAWAIFEAANGTICVGSASSGANGDVTSTTLPGGISVGFTGHDVRHADGRQLQRLGLQPDVPIEPTIAGLRAGRDEVLERALAYVTEGR